MVYIASRSKLRDYALVQVDMEKIGFVKEIDPRMIDKKGFKEIEARVIGFVEPDRVNGIITGNSGYYLYNINMEKDWKKYLKV